MGVSIDLAGQKFGRLTAIKIVGKKNGKNEWLCLCECGNIKLLDTNKLRTGHTKSCGCLHRDKLINEKTTHGKSDTRLYRMYRGMVNRCEYKKDLHYANYGGRGISICKEWRSDFENFEKWSLENGYKPGLTIDRINNNSNYGPDNCRWVDITVQANNKSNNLYLIINGERKTLQQWADISGIHRCTIQRRVKSGWPNKYLLLPPKNGRKMNEIQNIKRGL